MKRRVFAATEYNNTTASLVNKIVYSIKVESEGDEKMCYGVGGLYCILIFTVSVTQRVIKKINHYMCQLIKLTRNS